jgi:TonB family protein
MLALMSAPGDESDQLAAPKFRSAPIYPTACTPPPDAPIRKESVIIVYRVLKDGRTADIRVRESTNSCFNDAAVAAARTWSFEPARAGGKKVEQEDFETTVSFVFSEESPAPAALVDFDARPIARTPPRYPERCMYSANAREVITLEFNVTAKGTTEDIRVVDSTNKCLNDAATLSVRRWKYAPKTIDGAPTMRPGVQTLITFELAGDGVGIMADRLRPPVLRALTKVSRDLEKDVEPQQILAGLSAVEKEYGGNFTRSELALFHQLRGAAKIKSQDYRGALDDLRIAYANGATGSDADGLRRLIEQLEAAVAAMDAGTPQPPADDVPRDAAPPEPADK